MFPHLYFRNSKSESQVCQDLLSHIYYTIFNYTYDIKEVVFMVEEVAVVETKEMMVEMFTGGESMFTYLYGHLLRPPPS